MLDRADPSRKCLPDQAALRLLAACVVAHAGLGGCAVDKAASGPAQGEDAVAVAADVQSAELAETEGAAVDAETVPPCKLDSDCADLHAQACQVSICLVSSGVCKFIAAPGSGACDDGEPCTVDCSDSLSGACQHSNVARNCDDGDACTASDECVDGRCSGVYANCDDGLACTIDSCDPKSVICQHKIASGTCFDGDACVTGKTCESGNCVGGTPISCDDGYVCTLDNCDSLLGCSHVAGPVGVPCAEGAQCLSDGACVLAMACQGMPALCDDHEECTLEFCDPQQGCVHVPLDEGAQCDDNDPCTPLYGGKCAAGKCVNPDKVCGCGEDADCAKFDDGDLCNGTYHCAATPGGKLCQFAANSPVVCPPLASSSCKVAVCQPETGKCLVHAAPEAAFCDDGDACTAASACQAGVCTTTAAQACADGSACTSDSCDPVLGCINVATAGCVDSCADATASCDDGNPCTVDGCKAGQGCVHAPVSCNPHEDACLSGTCVVTGAHSYRCDVAIVPSTAPLPTPKPCSALGLVGGCPPGYGCTAPNDDLSAGTCQPLVSVACSDGNACTVGDVCGGGVCAPGKPVGCDDGDPCTQDACGADSCLHLPIQGCVACLSEMFKDATLPANFAAWSETPQYVNWVVKPEGANHRLVAQWKGPLLFDNGTTVAYFIARRLFFGPGVAPHIDFRYRAKFGSVTCGSDDLAVFINGSLVWRRCDSTPSGGANAGWIHETVDLSAWIGAPVDIDLRVIAGAQPQAAGFVEIDDLRVTGACTTACLGGDFEPRSDARALPSSPVPQGWEFVSSDPSYVNWQRTLTGGHTSMGALTASYQGKPEGGVAVVARFVLHQIQATSGSQLRFSSRALRVGDSSCTDDVLTVRVAGIAVLQQCHKLLKWSMHTVDLSPWAGQDVDVAFEVKTGATAAATGSFQVDDIAVTGACSYACFRATFDDPGDLATWWHGETQAAPAWSTYPKTQTESASVGVDFADSLPMNSLATLMPADKWRWVMPVMGATLQFRYKLATTEPSCPLSSFRVRMAWQYRGIAPTLPSEALSGPYVADIDGRCQDSGGWQAFSAELGDPARGRKFEPLFMLQKRLDVPLGLRMDDLIIRCR